jgi:hypothetical protein
MATNVHLYLNWAKERIDEMDAVVSTLEGKVSQVNEQSRNTAERLLSDMRRRRDTFLENMQKQAQAGEAAWAEARTKMETDWNGFQADIKKFIDNIGEQVKQQQTTFQEVAAAQLKAWREAADKMQTASAELATEQRGRFEAAVQQMKADASVAEANFERLKSAGAASWTALSAALAESRAAFDRANQAAWDAFKRAGSGS